jgi:hypothetical protein
MAVALFMFRIYHVGGFRGRINLVLHICILLLALTAGERAYPASY